jgi:glycosyltransferase involved in cell wall biosynthesis
VSSTGRTVLIANPGADLYGSDRMALETAEALAQAGWRVVVSVPHDGPLLNELRQAGAETVFCRTPVVRKSALHPLGLFALVLDFVLGVVPAVATLRRVRPDVVYVSTVTAPLWLLLARLLRFRIVCHVHEGEASASKLVLRALNAPLFLAHELVINSRFSLGVLTRAYPSLARRTTVVLNAVRGPSKVQQSREQLDEPYRVLFVGRLSARKGPDVLLDAIVRLRDSGVPVHLDLVGAVFPGYEWYEAQLRGVVRDTGLGQDVTFHGFQRDVWPYLAATDIAVVPSTVDEPFGNTAVEAALAARPLIVSELAGLREAAHGLTAAIRVPPSDPGAIAAAIQTVVDDWATYRERAGNDAEFAADRYSPKAYADQMVAIVNGARR